MARKPEKEKRNWQNSGKEKDKVISKMKENGDMESLVKGLTNRGKQTNEMETNKS